MSRKTGTGRPVGRPTTCSRKLAESVCNGLRAGLSIDAACVTAGISATSYHAWRARAEEGGVFAEFAELTTRALSEGGARLEAVIIKAAPADWRAAAFILERRFPDTWSKRTQITGADGGPVQAEVTVARVDAILAGRTDADLGIPSGDG